jgi:hypothetical protein
MLAATSKGVAVLLATALPAVFAEITAWLALTCIKL